MSTRGQDLAARFEAANAELIALLERASPSNGGSERSTKASCGRSG